jgi:hypothetical protein
MAEQEQPGVAFPVGDDGRRSTAAVGRAVVADALRAVDPAGALAAEQETNWRAGYLVHFRRLVEAGLASREAALSIAGAGLSSLYERMRVVEPDGDEVALERLRAAVPARRFGTAEVAGHGVREEEFSLPYAGSRLRGDDLRRRLDAWVAAGVMEPSAAEAVREVVAHPEWLRLPDSTVAVLGAGAEMGPLTSLLRWGARVAAVDLPRSALWLRVLDTARRSAGSLVAPVPHGQPEGKADLAHVAGADLITEAPAVAEWLGALDGRLVVGNYVYADGAVNVRVSTAVDALTVRLLEERPDLALAFLATPTDVFAVPSEAVEHSVRAYAGRSTVAKLVGRPLRTLSAGRLLRRGYVPGSDPGISDSLVAQQGPNYALAKRLQRWRATVAREAGTTVSMNVAPPTRTRSVVKNRALAAAYAGAHRFGVEVFEPATANVLMAALLVHDLNTGGRPPHDHPWQDEAFAAVHGGLWRTPYAPRSALGLAALLGYGAARG